MVMVISCFFLRKNVFYLKNVNIQTAMTRLYIIVYVSYMYIMAYYVWEWINYHI